MATGFQQRFKGKILAAQIWIQGGGPLAGAGAIQALSTSSTTTTITNAGVTTINSSSVLSIWRLAPPTQSVLGLSKTVQLSPVSSGVFVTASTDGTVLFNGSSINTTFKSTVVSVIELVATSTTNWAIAGVFPGSTLVASPLTLSTST